MTTQRISAICVLTIGAIISALSSMTWMQRNASKCYFRSTLQLAPAETSRRYKSRRPYRQKGFVPYEGCQAIIPENLPQDKHDKLKYEYLQKLITTCQQQQIQLIFAASPQLSYQSDSVFIPLKRSAKLRRFLC